jgi:hypothetical protein
MCFFRHYTRKDKILSPVLFSVSTDPDIANNSPIAIDIIYVSGEYLVLIHIQNKLFIV